MSNQQKQWGAIIVMIALFAMIAFVTNLCSPMGVIVKNQFGTSNFLAMVGNYGNFMAYLVMGFPAGMMIKKFGYKRTALIGLIVGIVGILVQWLSGSMGFIVYLIGAFISGFCMCILNTVVNPMLNLLGGGGNKGNQLIQIGGVFNSTAAVAVYILMGALIGEAAKAKISDATPALMIALAIFVIAFVVILFTKIEEPEQQAEVKVAAQKDPYSAFSFRHFKLGILAIGLYGGIEMGIPGFILQYLTADTPEIIEKKTGIMDQFEKKAITIDEATIQYLNPLADAEKGKKLTEAQDLLAKTEGEDNIKELTKNNDEAKAIKETKEKIEKGEITAAKAKATTPGFAMDAGYVGTLSALYFLFMLVGRFVGGVVGGKVSTKAMMTFVSGLAIILLLLGILLPSDITMSVPGINYEKLEIMWGDLPLGIVAFLLVGLCASVMWGGIFNLATEGLGKYTAIASGAFMTMVCGFAIMVAIQGLVADWSGSYVISYWVPLACAVYILYYALIGSKNVNTDIPVE